MIYIINSYFKFIWKSTNAHGVHSPFVFDLINNCFYKKLDDKQARAIDQYRNELLQNLNKIKVQDFGAGSRVFKSDERVVSDIAKTAGISLENAYRLRKISNFLQAKNILELGTSLGLGAFALDNQKSDLKITSLEGCIQTAGVAQENLQKFKSNVTVKVGEFTQSIEQISSEKFDLIYFDGNHTQEATQMYFQKLMHTAHNHTCWIFDDIHWSKDMEMVWQWIKEQPEVSVTIDTFQWGIVFFRKEQVKENFIVRPFKNSILDSILGSKELWGLIHYNNK